MAGAIGLAFVDILGDTSRAEPQIERDMNRVLAVVGDAIRPVEIQAAVDSGAEADLTRELNSDIRAVQAASDALNVRVDLDPETRTRLRSQLRAASAQLRAARSEVEVRVANRPVVESTVEAVQEAVRIAEATAPAVEIETRVDSDRVSRLGSALSGIGSAAGRAVGPVATLAGGLGAVGGALNAVAGVAAVLQSIGPAAAIAAPAILSVVSATGAVKLAMLGVSDAVEAAMDPSDPEAFEESLKGLAPEARDFARAVRSLQPEFKALQQSVQNEFFKGLDDTLKSLSKAVLPQLQSSLTATAGQLRSMAQGAANAASELSANGTLGEALDGARQGIQNLAGVPAIAVKAFGQLAAAAAPAFDRVTAAVAGKASQIGEKLSGAFSSGALSAAIDTAIAQVGNLLSIVGNLGKVLQNVLSQGAGATVLDALKGITGELAKITAGKEAQETFKALFDTARVLGDTLKSLLGPAFEAIGRTIQALAPGAQALIKALGDGLKPIIEALGPVLEALANAISKIVIAFAPMLVTVGQLVGALLPVLTPLLDGVAQLFVMLAPVIQQVADLLSTSLAPIFAQLPALVQPLVDLLLTFVSAVLPVMVDLLDAAKPAFDELSKAVVELIGALAPLLESLAILLGKFLQVMVPLIRPIIGIVGELAAIFAQQLAGFITNIVVPALTVVTELLSGDFSGAFRAVKDLIKGFIRETIELFISLPKEIIKAFGDATQILLQVGAQVMSGLIRGIKNKIGELADTLGGVTDFIRENKGPIEVDRKLLVPAGEAIMDGLIGGIAGRKGALHSELSAVTDLVRKANPGALGVGGPQSAGMGAVFAATAPLPVSQQPAFTVQTFIGDRELTDIVDTRIVTTSRAQGRQVQIGTRR
jgi:phage-related protein